MKGVEVKMGKERNEVTRREMVMEIKEKGGKNTSSWGGSSLGISALFVTGTIATTLFVSCKKEEIIPLQRGCEESFECVIRSAGTFEDVENKTVEIGKKVSSLPVDSGTWQCTTTTYQAIIGNIDYPVFDPNASVVYPGNLLQGATIQKGTPEVIPVRRGGGTFSINLLNGSWKTYVTVNEIKKSTVTQAINDIIAYNNEIMPAKFSFDYKRVSSNEELAVTLGVNATVWNITAAGQLSISDKEGYLHYLVTLKQEFYTISYDLPTSVDELFHPSVTPKDLAKYVYPGNPAAYISDVTYGRVIYMLIESKSSASEIEGAISGSFAGLNIGGQFDVSYLQQLDSVTVKVLALGGSVKSTFAALNATQLNTLTYILGQSADIKTGVPLSYVVRAVYDNKIVKNKLSLEYDVTDCQFIPAGP